MSKKGSKHDGRTNDLTLSWLLTTHGEQWQQYAAEWMKEQHAAADTKLLFLGSFFKTYLLNYVPYAINVTDFFRGQNGHKCSSEEFTEALKKSGLNNTTTRSTRINYTCDFIDWMIDTHFSVEDDNGISRPIVTNPFNKCKHNSGGSKARVIA